jgi:hypothetical protein
MVISFSTPINDRGRSGTHVRAAAGIAKVELLDNILVGPGGMDLRVSDPTARNLEATADDFADALKYDWRLRRSSKMVGTAGIAGALSDTRARPEREYVQLAA